MSNIPEALLAEAYDAYREHSDARLDGLDAVLAVIARHWPTATPSDGYKAGFRDGVEKAAAEVERLWGVSLTGYQTAAALRALAPPDDGLIVGRLRWVEEKANGLWRAYVGELLIGTVFENHDGTGSWAVMHNADIRRADTPEAARAALVEAVRREVEGSGDAA